MKIPNGNLAAAFKASGKTQEEFSREHGVSIHTLRYYLYKRNKCTVASTSNHNHRKTSAGLPALSAPAFISFNRDALEKTGITARHTVTIIHGSFSLKDVAGFLAMMGVGQ